MTNWTDYFSGMSLEELLTAQKSEFNVLSEEDIDEDKAAELKALDEAISRLREA